MAKKKVNITNDDNEFDLYPNYDFDIDGFDLVDSLFSEQLESRYVVPKLHKEVNDNYLKSDNAYKLASQIDLNKNNRYFVIVNGSFVFGDFLEALLIHNQAIAKTVTISTLSLSEININSLAGLMDYRYIENLNLIVSSYFYGMEKYNLVPYIYESLDIDNRFNFAVCSTHCKTILIHSINDRYYVVHGSANLRSSQNLEQIVIEENKELYDFNMEYQKCILDKYSTINKEIRSKQLWQVVHQAEAVEKVEMEKQGHQKKYRKTQNSKLMQID